MKDAKQLGIGKVSVLWQVGNLDAPNPKVQVFDNDSECWIIGTLEAGGDAEGFAKDAIAAFPLK